MVTVAVIGVVTMTALVWFFASSMERERAAEKRRVKMLLLTPGGRCEDIRVVPGDSHL
jgi:hypothetical protein